MAEAKAKKTKADTAPKPSSAGNIDDMINKMKQGNLFSLQMQERREAISGDSADDDDW